MKSARQQATGPGRIRQLNREAALDYFRDHGSASRTTLVQSLDLSPAAVSSLTGELLDDGLLRHADAPPGSGRQGRPMALLELNPDVVYALGMVLRPVAGKVRVETAWVDYAGQVRVLAPTPVEDADNPELVMDGIDRALRRLHKAVPDTRRIGAVMVGIPGVVDSGRIAIAPRLPISESASFIAELHRRIPYPVDVHNDVNLAAMAELFQQPRLRDMSFAYLFIGSGVGAALTLHGQLWTGNGWAGEVGQLRITRTRKRRPSFEELLGVDNELALALETLGLPGHALDMLAARAADRQRPAVRVVEHYAESLCDLIQVINAVLDPDEVIIDFPNEALLTQLLARVETLMADSALRVVLSTPSVSHNSSVRGAALAALEQSLDAVHQRRRLVSA